MFIAKLFRRGQNLGLQVPFIALITTAVNCVSVAQTSDDAALKEPEPIIALIETYGLCSVSRDSVIEAAGLQVGDDLRETNMRQAIERIEAIPGVHKAAAAGIYGKLLKDEKLGLVLYLGINEEGSRQLLFRRAPSGDDTLPVEIVDANDTEQRAFGIAAAKGQFGEDRLEGHSLAADPELRAAQEQFIPLANTHWDTLVDVLHNSRDATQRAIAAKVIAYAKNKESVVQELVPALHDPDAAVRNNSTRALSVIFSYAKAHPDKAISPPADLVRRLIDMLHSLEWTDRNKSTALLVSLDENKLVLGEMSKKAVPGLVEMSRWQSAHGAMAFMLLGRLDDMTHDESRLVWQRGGQSSVIARLQGGAAKE